MPAVCPNQLFKKISRKRKDNGNKIDEIMEKKERRARIRKER